MDYIELMFIFSLKIVIKRLKIVKERFIKNVDIKVKVISFVFSYDISKKM